MIDKAFDKWVNKEHKRTKKGGSAITKKEIRSIYNEPFTAGYKQSRIDTLGEIKKKIKIRLKGVKSMIISEWVYEVIDTELKKTRE